MTADAGRMHQFDPEMTDLILEFVRDRLSLEETPVDGLGVRAELHAAIEGLMTDRGRPAAEVLSLYTDHIADTILSSDSPRFWAFIPAAPTKAALLFDMVVSAASLQGCSWLEAAGAVAAENQALRVMMNAAGLPASAGGVFVSGGSAGNLSALVVARDTARRTRHAAGAPEGRLCVLVSDQAHSSIKNALNIVAMDAIVIPTSDGRLDEQALEALTDDQLVDVVAIVATAGTTNAGIIDDLVAVSAFARTRGIWMHVDAAYGGAGLLASSVRPLYAGIENSDSIVMDPHKWWFAPFDCAALMYREPHIARAVHTQDASYLDVIHSDDGDLNPSDLAYHLTRRARGLALWFSLAVNGLDAYREAVEHSIRMANFAAAAIKESDHLEVVREPGLSVVLFRRPGWGVTDYNAWAQRLLREQIAFVAHSSWRGEPVGRLVFLHPNTTEQMVHQVLETLH